VAAHGGARDEPRELRAVTSAARFAIALALLTLAVDLVIFDEPAVTAEELERTGVPGLPPIPTGPPGAPWPTTGPTEPSAPDPATPEPTGPFTYTLSGTCVVPPRPVLPNERPSNLPGYYPWPPDTCEEEP
jgi:hypothetical protein